MQWSDYIADKAAKVINTDLKRPYIGAHLRIGVDWVCSLIWLHLWNRSRAFYLCSLSRESLSISRVFQVFLEFVPINFSGSERTNLLIFPQTICKTINPPPKKNTELTSPWWLCLRCKLVSIYWCINLLLQERACQHVTDGRNNHLFASAQCTGYKFEHGTLTQVWSEILLFLRQFVEIIFWHIGNSQWCLDNTQSNLVGCSTLS